MDDDLKFRRLVDRLARLHAADAWEQGLNPSQAEALLYLVQANRFSRQPSHVAAYLATTRGTVSQTLKALLRKGLVKEARSLEDKRKVRYDVTATGLALGAALVEGASGQGGSTNVAQLEAVLRAALARRGMRSFGVCQSCRFHQTRGQGGHCALLDVDLDPQETRQLCHEHQAA
jgi:DNA-binding MarR family transcriptional regulator